jgi:hypothetical protein
MGYENHLSTLFRRNAGILPKNSINTWEWGRTDGIGPLEVEGQASSPRRPKYSPPTVLAE